MPAVSAMPASFAIEVFFILVSPNCITTEISGFMPVTLAGSHSAIRYSRTNFSSRETPDIKLANI